MGDTNGDGAVDLADGIYLQRHILRGGPAPVCAEAANVLPDGFLDVADSQAIWTHAFTANGTFPALAEDACSEVTPPSDNLECGRVAFGIRSDGAGKATVTLTSPDLEVEGWQISIAAEGCTLSGTVEGTQGADRTAGGSRDAGYARVDPAAGGLVAAVALSWLDAVVLEPSSDAVPILSLTLTPGDGCTCKIRFEDGLTGLGQPVRNEVVSKGRAWLPTTHDATVRACN